MIYAAAAFLLGAAFATGKLLGWLIDRPDPGTRAKPHTGTHAREWPWRERAVFRVSARVARRQRERDRDAATVDTFRDILAGQYMGEEAERAMWGEHYGQPGEPGWEGTAEDYAADMAAGPLMPLPPEVTSAMPLPSEDWWHGDCPKCPVCGSHRHGGECEATAEDPLAVLGDDAHADALVGPVGNMGHDAGNTMPEDTYDHLREGQYAEAGAVGTGFFAAAILDKYEAEQLLASYAERAHAGGA